MNRKKDVKKKPDTAIIVAIIALVGTLITAVLTSPVLIAIISKTPPPTSIETPSATSQLFTPDIQSSPTTDLSLPTTPRPHNLGEKIAFSSTKDNTRGLYLFDTRDNSVVAINPNLTGGMNGYFHFKWSFDGKKILYSGHYPKSGLYIVDIETNQSNLLTDKDLIFAFNWSPSGSQVAFGDDKGIYTIDVISKNLQLLTSFVLEVSGMTDAIAWSPDNTEIALSAWENAGNNLNLYLINPNGSNLRNLNQWINNDPSKSDFVTYNLVWSPDSKYLALMTDRSILLMSSDMMTKILYSSDIGFDTTQDRLSWSPDSTQIIFDDIYNVIRIINISDETVTAMPLNGSCPNWSPDGKNIIFVAPGLNGNEIFLTNDTGTERLTDNMQVECATWQP